MTSDALGEERSPWDKSPPYNGLPPARHWGFHPGDLYLACSCLLTAPPLLLLAAPSALLQ